MAASSSSTVASTEQVIDINNWDRWPQEDRAHFEKMKALGLLDEFWTPDEELRSKKGKNERRKLRFTRREHNANIISKAEAAAAERAECEQECQECAAPSPTPQTVRDNDPCSPQVCA